MTNAKTIQRVSVEEGYDLWAEDYDATPNPIVAMDARHTIGLLAPRAGEWILDAGCGTGRNLGPLLAAGSRVVGLDFSLGMLRVARRKFPAAPLLRGDLQRDFPIEAGRFDAVLCALIGEHLDDLPSVFREIRRALRPGGRFVFSVYHPALAMAGKEANFTRGAVEYRLGAVRHTVADYREQIAAAGFAQTAGHEFDCDTSLVAAVPAAAKYHGQPVLLAIEARNG
jgi:SAM-dependent methyltransferase